MYAIKSAASKLSEAIRYHFDDLKDSHHWKDHMDFLYTRKALDIPDTLRIESEADNDKVRDVITCTSDFSLFTPDLVKKGHSKLAF